LQDSKEQHLSEIEIVCINVFTFLINSMHPCWIKVRYWFI